MRKLLYKQLIIMLVCTFCGQTIVASTLQTKAKKTPIKAVYYDWNGIFVIRTEEKKLDILGDWMKRNKSEKIIITGWEDKTKPKNPHYNIAEIRVYKIQKWLVDYYKIDTNRIEVIVGGVDNLAETDELARRVDVALNDGSYIRPKDSYTPDLSQYKEADSFKKIEDTSKKSTTAPSISTSDYQKAQQLAEKAILKAEQAEQEVNQLKQELAQLKEQSSTCITDAEKASAKADSIGTKLSKEDKYYFSTHTNLLYWCAGMMNIGLEIKKGNGFSLLVNGGYSPLSNSDWKYNMGGWFVAPEVRWYMGKKKRGHLGIQGLVSGYNFKFNTVGHQGHIVGGGITGGYTAYLSENIDMDFSLGVGYGYAIYDTYKHHEDIKVNTFIKQNNTKHLILPINAGITLIWKINK